jgi:hypothetical protein
VFGNQFLKIVGSILKLNGNRKEGYHDNGTEEILISDNPGHHCMTSSTRPGQLPSSITDTDGLWILNGIPK